MGVYVPRFFAFGYMRVYKNKYHIRKVVFIVRILTTLVLMGSCVAIIIGELSILGKSKGLLAFVTVPGFILYAIYLAWAFLFDVPYIKNHKDYNEEGKKKEKEHEQKKQQHHHSHQNSINSSYPGQPLT